MGKRGPKPKERVMTQQHLDVLHLLALGHTDKATAIGVRDGLISGGAA